MKPAVTASAGPDRIALSADGAAWQTRAASLYQELGRPARAMVRRAFRGAFSDDELDDVYASAWVGVLRALAGRHSELSDEEIRKYVFTAVANQAAKEIRRRGRKPTSPLELVDRVPDAGSAPDERALDAEQSRVTRDLLSSMPSRRRAVIMLRYGWGLDPAQICELIEGLSPRAYRKEITRGVDELAEKLRRVESGQWCDDREPLLKAYAAGLADADQRRQADAHLSHCRECSRFVARLSGRLHDLGGAAAASGALEGIDGRLSLADRVGELGERARDSLGGLLSRGADVGPEAVAAGAAGTGARGAGAVGAGAMAKLAGLGTAGKVAVACLGSGAAATACVAAGLGGGLPRIGGGDERPRAERPAAAQRSDAERAASVLPTQAGNQWTAEHATAEPTDVPGEQSAPATTEPVAAEETQTSDFSFAGGGTDRTAPPPPTEPSSTPAGGGDSSGGGGSASGAGGDFAYGSP